MFDAFRKSLVRIRHNDEGVTLVEYGVALALAIAVGVTALGLLGIEVTAMITATEGVMTP